MAMTQFEPNYENLVKAARNIEVKRIPLYEHYVSPKVMETLRGTTFEDCYHGDDRDLDNYFHHYLKIPNSSLLFFHHHLVYDLQ